MTCFLETSCSPPIAISSTPRFYYFEQTRMRLQQQRCNSLPGSLQSVVGSFMKLGSSSTKPPHTDEPNHHPPSLSLPVGPQPPVPSSPKIAAQAKEKIMSKATLNVCSTTRLPPTRPPKPNRVAAIQSGSSTNTFNFMVSPEHGASSSVPSAVATSSPIIIKNISSATVNMRKPPISPSSLTNSAVYRTEMKILPKNSPVKVGTAATADAASLPKYFTSNLKKSSWTALFSSLSLCYVYDQISFFVNS